ncbi:potassium channel family protein [uncultured Amphritea sp.]|uniref:potassium channel family protein n=1 Tax=Amphritea sp. TaxID=1872502 RepID=UPI0025E65AB6|nr:potassium channel family protein [uncultured Amphritea sp.]
MVRRYFYSTDEYNVRNYSTLFLGVLAFGLLYSLIALLSFPLLWFEQNHPGANILSYADAFWALQMSASTIGFGDFYPTSQGGRIIVALMFYIGVGIVGFIGAQIASKMVGFADTNVRNRELRRQNDEILSHNKELEHKLDLLFKQLERASATQSMHSTTHKDPTT